MATVVHEPSESREQRPPPSVIRENLLAGRMPLLIESSDASVTAEKTLQHLMIRAMVARNHIKRREIEALQRSRNRSKRVSADGRQLTLARSQYQTEALALVDDWRRIAVRNGLSEEHLPRFSDSQPLEAAEEFMKRALHASRIASRTQLIPMDSPSPEDPEAEFPSTSPPSAVVIDSPELRPESGSLLSASPPDTIFSQRTRMSSNTVSPSSWGLLDPRRRASSFVGSISLGLPAVIDCNAEL